jgi:hypothetical protein
MVRRDQMLAPILDPLDRPAGQARRKRDQKILGVEFATNAKPATDIVFDHVDCILGQTHQRGQDSPVKKGTLLAPETVSLPCAASHSASTPRGSIIAAV